MNRHHIISGFIGCICLALIQGGTAKSAPASQEHHGAAFNQAVAAYDAGDFPTAFAIFKSMAHKNDPAVLRNLGHMARRGLGTPKDLVAAFDYYLRAAQLGLPAAQLNVANAYEEGMGTKINLVEARHWRKAAAQADHPLGHLAYGTMLAEGIGGPKKQQDALVHLTRAYEQGVADAGPKISTLMRQIFPEPSQATPQQKEQQHKPARNHR